MRQKYAAESHPTNHDAVSMRQRLYEKSEPEIIAGEVSGGASEVKDDVGAPGRSRLHMERALWICAGKTATDNGYRPPQSGSDSSESGRAPKTPSAYQSLKSEPQVRRGQ